MRTVTTTQALADILSDLNQAVITDYDLGVQMHRLFQKKKQGDRQLAIQKEIPDREDFDRIVGELDANGLLKAFTIPHTHKIFGKKIEFEEEVVCSIDPFAYISHLSAMEYHGLTDTVPRVLIYSTPDAKTWKLYAKEKMEKDFQGPINAALPQLKPIKIKKFGKKNIIQFNSIHSGAYINVKDRSLRVSSIGRTFLDMVRKPDLCDGIYNVIRAYEEHAELYLELILDEVDRNGTKIETARVGYLLEERCNIQDNATINAWKADVQRGGSRKLDPNNDYSKKYSETWCISINIEE